MVARGGSTVSAAANSFHQHGMPPLHPLAMGSSLELYFHVVLEYLPSQPGAYSTIKSAFKAPFFCQF